MAKAHLYKSYVSTAATIIQHYDGTTPLNDFLKKYFALHKKFGSRDRKLITNLCYSYYRLGMAEMALETEERILLAAFLCTTTQNDILSELKPEWKDNITAGIAEKLQHIGYPFSIDNIFPWQDELSDGIDAKAFALSHLIQPDLFLRVRPGYNEQVEQKLRQVNIDFTLPAEDCIALANNTKIDALLILNKEVVVQDYSSQRIAEFLELTKHKTQNSKLSVWDCCAASGGKSILAKDILGNIDLTVSDIRASIIHNLKQRFAAAGIKQYHSFVADLTSSKSEIRNLKSEIIIADVPCSGSGTWGRSPEQLHYFTAEKITYYSNLQKQIIRNVLPHVKQGGYLLYITCSVFKKENEEMVDFILTNSSFQLIKKEVLVGYDKKADTMFGALLRLQ